MRLLDSYGVIYPLAYLIAVAIMLWLHWGDLFHNDNPVYLLAAVFGAAAGAALTLAILVEVGGRIVLLIPATVRKLRREGRQERDARYQEALDRFGVEEDGVAVLRFTPEVRQFLGGEPGDERSYDAGS